jgi:TRAP-type uncharacterized transport system substrate-binding protein
MRFRTWIATTVVAALLCCMPTYSPAQEATVALKLVDVGQTGIAVKRPVFAGACKACPWGILALVTQAAMKSYGYDVRICFVCWSEYGPREMADRTKPTFPRIKVGDPLGSYIEDPPDAVPDISATSENNLVAAWNGTGPYAKDNKPRRNYRVVAVVHQPNFFMVAATKKSGITDPAQVKTRTQPTWIAFSQPDAAAQALLQYYGITEEVLKAHGGGFLDTEDRLRRAGADMFLGGAVLADTPEQRVWYEASQLNDLTFFDVPDAVRDKIVAAGGYVKENAPIAFLRGAERPIPTVMRSANYIYVRDDAPDDFTYTVAKALDEHQNLLRIYGDPWYYDIHTVASPREIPMAPGALKYYRERGYVR